MKAVEDKLHKTVMEAVPVREILSVWSTIDNDVLVAEPLLRDLEQRTEEEVEVEGEPEPEPETCPPKSAAKLVECLQYSLEFMRVLASQLRFYNCRR